MYKAQQTQRGLNFLIPLSSEPLIYLSHKVDAMSICCSLYGQELNLISPDNFEGAIITISSDYFHDLYGQQQGMPTLCPLRNEPALYFPTPQQYSELRSSLLQVRESFKHQQGLNHSELQWLNCFCEIHIVPQLTSIMANTRQSKVRLRPSPLTESIQIIVDNLDSPPSVAELAQALKLTPRYLQQLFKMHLDLTPRQFISYCRLNAARRKMKALSYQRGNIADIANNLGYWHMSNFALEFKKMFGQTPSEFIVSQTTIHKL